MALRAASQSGLGYPRWVSYPLAVGSGHEWALVPLLVLLLVGVVGGAFTGVLVLLCLALGVVKNRSTASSPEAWLVAMSRSSLVVRGPLRPSL